MFARIATAKASALSLLFVLSAWLPPAPAGAEEYKVDSAHSFVSFRVKHMGVSFAYGRFDDLGGEFNIDEPSGNGLTFDFVIKADSIDTGHPKRDQHLKSADFFNVKQYPTIEFKSKSVRRNGEKGIEIGGDLTLHGVTRAVNAHMERIGSGKDPGGAVPHRLRRHVCHQT